MGQGASCETGRFSPRGLAFCCTGAGIRCAVAYPLGMYGTGTELGTGYPRGTYRGGSAAVGCVEAGMQFGRDAGFIYVHSTSNRIKYDALTLHE